MPNLKAKIDGHNKKILENTPPPKTKLCNCLKKENCPMRGACLTENVLYYTRISCDDKTGSNPARRSAGLRDPTSLRGSG